MERDELETNVQGGHARIGWRGHASMWAPQRLLPRGEQLAAALQPIRQPQGHIAQVHQDAGHAARHVERETPATTAE